MLNVDDLEILEFAPYFQGQCQPGDNSKFCGGFIYLQATCGGSDLCNKRYKFSRLNFIDHLIMN